MCHSVIFSQIYSPQCGNNEILLSQFFMQIFEKKFVKSRTKEIYYKTHFSKLNFSSISPKFAQEWHIFLKSRGFKVLESVEKPANAGKCSKSCGLEKQLFSHLNLTRKASEFWKKSLFSYFSIITLEHFILSEKFQISSISSE